jgi:hypothetical protein
MKAESRDWVILQCILEAHMSQAIIKKLQTFIFIYIIVIGLGGQSLYVGQSKSSRNSPADGE